MRIKIDIFFDGACRNIKGQSSPAGMGVAIFLNNQYEEELSLAWGLGPEQTQERLTSNIAEWLACTQAFKIASELKAFYPDAIIRVYSDSQIITNQFNGLYNTGVVFGKYKGKARHYSKSAGCSTVIWIPREQNKQADILSKEGLKLYREQLIN